MKSMQNHDQRYLQNKGENATLFSGAAKLIVMMNLCTYEKQNPYTMLLNMIVHFSELSAVSFP